jgi:hypothetical protein
MFSFSRAARPVLAAVLAISAISASAAPANAAFLQLPHFAQPVRSPALSGPFATSSGIANWTRLHTEAPSQFHAPLGGFNAPSFGHGAVGHGFFNGSAGGPAGAQFGRLPSSNQSFIDPTHNSFQAHQTQNSQQATNTQMSSQAVQGRNCYRNAILAGLCQGRP